MGTVIAARPLTFFIFPLFLMVDNLAGLEGEMGMRDPAAAAVSTSS